MFGNSYVKLHLLLIATLALGVVAAAVEAGMYNGYETPDYRVERSEGAFEVRTYGPQVVAEVSVTGTRSQAASRGFRALAGYIVGGNDRQENIAMTAPVSQIPVENGYTVRFAMPASFNLDTLPAPKRDAVRLKRLEGSRLAVVQFSGRWTAARLAAKEAELRAWAASNDIAVGGEPTYFFYNDPFTLPWKRRNEVALSLR